jgi:hypothetical protein
MYSIKYPLLIPLKRGTQSIRTSFFYWVPACAGMRVLMKFEIAFLLPKGEFFAH